EARGRGAAHELKKAAPVPGLKLFGIHALNLTSPPRRGQESALPKSGRTRGTRKSGLTLFEFDGLEPEARILVLVGIDHDGVAVGELRHPRGMGAYGELRTRSGSAAAAENGCFGETHVTVIARDKRLVDVVLALRGDGL